MLKAEWSLVSFQSECAARPSVRDEADQSCSGRLQTVTLKAEPAKETVKTGAAKGSWGKPGPKAAASVSVGKEDDGTRTVLSEGDAGFEIQVPKGMFESNRI